MRCCITFRAVDLLYHLGSRPQGWRVSSFSGIMDGLNGSSCSVGCVQSWKTSGATTSPASTCLAPVLKESPFRNLSAFEEPLAELRDYILSANNPSAVSSNLHAFETVEFAVIMVRILSTMLILRGCLSYRTSFWQRCKGMMLYPWSCMLTLQC